MLAVEILLSEKVLQKKKKHVYNERGEIRKTIGTVALFFREAVSIRINNQYIKKSTMDKMILD